jgi:hypothetical protein
MQLQLVPWNGCNNKSKHTTIVYIGTVATQMNV